jgi:hypothetical protein
MVLNIFAVFAFVIAVWKHKGQAPEGIEMETFGQPSVSFLLYQLRYTDVTHNLLNHTLSLVTVKLHGVFSARLLNVFALMVSAIAVWKNKERNPHADKDGIFERDQ